MINPLTSLDITSLNRVPAHTRWRAYETENQALANENNGDAVSGSVSKYIQSLNGTYLFKLFPHPEAVPENFWQHRNGFTGIPVPANWELHGHGEPIYTNFLYPWDYNAAGSHLIKPHTKGTNAPNPPHIPQDNPTGCYFRTFGLPADYTGRDIFLRFDGVETAYKLWINGQFIGYAEDSKLPSEFEITSYIHPGENDMAIQVMRWSKSAYLEDQDYWHLSGIHGPVWLIAKPKARIQDYKILAGQDGRLSADVTISRVPGFADYTVKMSVYDKAGQIQATVTAPVNDRAEYTQRTAPTANTARLLCNVPSAQLWSPEKPVLYTVVLALVSPEGISTDIEACRVGFKKVEIVNGILYLNGQRLVAYGVNRHQHHYQTGRYVPAEWMLKEIIEMKRMNINAVRTCHYPDPDAWYELCDAYGLLVVCECNIETHGIAGQLTHDPAWASLFLERAVRMAQNFKNHACIFSWSLGNESGTGANHAAMAGFLREYDSTRICQYEAGGPGAAISDIRGDMYAPVSRIIELLTDTNDDRPVMLVEYLYQIRNAGGGLYHFPELTEKYTRFQGGFVWDWSDKCLENKNDKGETFLAYGGDFGESVTDTVCPLYMTNNGVVLPDLTWKPVAYELKQAYAPVVIRPAERFKAWSMINGTTCRYEIKNKSFTRFLSDYTVTMLLREDGYAVHSQILSFPELAPLSETTFEVKPEYSLKPECEYFIEFSIALKDASFYAQAGYETGCFQYPLQAACKGTLLSKVSKASSGLFPGVELSVDKETGGIRLIKDGYTYIQAGGLPCLDQPITGMDVHQDWGGMYALFDAVRHGNTTMTAEVITKTESAVTVMYKLLTFKKWESFVEIRYNLHENILVTEAFFNLNPKLHFVPRVGLEFVLPAKFNNLTYYGLGENENYSDRQMSAKMGVYKSTVAGQHFPFVPSSECGGHGETRWVALANGEGNNITFTGAGPFHFDARHNSIRDYQQAKHDHELPVRAETYVHIDAAHSGIGSDMAWSTVVRPEHLVKAGVYCQRFAISLE